MKTFRLIFGVFCLVSAFAGQAHGQVSPVVQQEIQRDLDNYFGLIRQTVSRVDQQREYYSTRDLILTLQIKVRDSNDIHLASALKNLVHLTGRSVLSQPKFDVVMETLKMIVEANSSQQYAQALQFFKSRF